MTPLLLIVVGLLGLIFASEVAVSGAKTLASRLGRSQMTVGVTIAAVGTSLPEIATNLAVAVSSGAEGGSGLAVGNIVGSCLSQITLLVGITAIFAPLHLGLMELRRDGAAAVAALLAMTVTAADGVTERWEGALLVAGYVAYLVHAWRTGGPAVAGAAQDHPPKSGTLGPLLRAVGGVSVLVLSADVMVDNAVVLARMLGVDESKIGLAVGVATGLPELAFALGGVRSGAPALAVGNLIGSNITDPLCSYGLGASVRAVEVPPEVLRLDVPVWGAATLLGLWLMSRPAGLGRKGGVLLVLVFVLYGVVRGVL